MNFNHLLIFQKVAEKRHFTRAAEELFISQPAVSKQVHEFENEMGEALLEQVGRKVQLTHAGQVLYEYACRIFALAKEAETVLEELRGLERGQLAVGASMTIGTYLLPQLLGQYNSLYPAISLTLDIANATEIQAKLLANKLDFGLVEGFVDEAELIKTEWRQDELVLIDAVKKPLLAATTVKIEQVLDSQVPLILREQGSGTRAVLEAALSQRGLKLLRPVLELNSLEAIKNAVNAGLGVSFVSEHCVANELVFNLLKIVKVDDFELKRSLYLVQARSKRTSKAAQAFLDLLMMRKVVLKSPKS